MQSTLYVDQAYQILFDEAPDAVIGARARRVAVMAHWDGRKFEVDPVRQQIGRLALCEIGLAWHMTDQYPYDFDLIAGRLLEMMPECGNQPITPRFMRDFLVAAQR